jgi:hypothetical protein
MRSEFRYAVCDKFWMRLALRGIQWSWKKMKKLGFFA